MNVYYANRRKKNRRISYIIKTTSFKQKGFVRFCYIATKVLRATAFLLGVANFIFVVFYSKDYFDLLFLIMTFGFPFGFSFIPEIVYRIKAGGDYRLRTKENVSISNEGFVYSFSDVRVGLSDLVFSIYFLYENVLDYEFEERTGIITIRGSFTVNTYKNGAFKESVDFKEISFLDVYDISISQLLKQNVILEEKK